MEEETLDYKETPQDYEMFIFLQVRLYKSISYFKVQVTSCLEFQMRLIVYFKVYSFVPHRFALF